MLGATARQLPAGSLKLLTYYQATEDQTLNFSVQGGGNCSTPAGVPFNCGQASSIDTLGSGRAALTKLVYQPWESFQYYATLGVGDYDLKVPSATITNDLTGDKPGYTFGVGLKYVFYPDTIVTPGLAIDASFTRSRYDFSRRFPGGSALINNNISERLDLYESQIAVLASHLFTLAQIYKFEPYGGIKWDYAWADLKDLTDGTHSGGGKKSIRPFIGLRVPVFEHEGFFAEASFVDGTQYATGLEIRFK